MRWLNGKPDRRSGIVTGVVYRSRRGPIILWATFAALAVPTAALAKGPIVRATTDVWGAVLKFLGF